MNVVIAVITRNRWQLLKECVGSFAAYKGLAGYKSRTTILVADDASADGTQEWLRDRTIGLRTELAQIRGGVARNSNRAIKFAQQHDADVLFILNDDIRVLNPRVFSVYIDAIQKTGYGHFRYTDERSAYKHPVEFEKNGVKLARRVAGDGAFMTVTREMIGVLGGFDAGFGMAGGEELDYLRRAEAAGFCDGALDVLEARRMIDVRQYHEPIKRSFSNSELEIGAKMWYDSMLEEPVIFKEVAT